MFDVFCYERFTRFVVVEWGKLNWTLVFCQFQFRLGWIICRFISSVFWFWLWWLALLRSCWRGGIYYRMVRIVLRLKVLDELLILMVRTIVRVFLQMYRGCLKKRCVVMIEDYLFVYLLVLYVFDELFKKVWEFYIYIVKLNEISVMRCIWWYDFYCIDSKVRRGTTYTFDILIEKLSFYFYIWKFFCAWTLSFFK